jgi:hypothetical protein
MAGANVRQLYGVQRVEDVINEVVKLKEFMYIKELRFWLEQMGGNSAPHQCLDHRIDGD